MTWTEEQLREYYSSGGDIRPERRDTSVAGGFRDLPPPEPDNFPENMPKVSEELAERLLTVEAYREAAFANGIPFRPNGLFPMNDPLLTQLSSDPGCHAFQKNVLGFDEDGEPTYVPADSFAHGDGGAANGVDLRCFYRPATRTARGIDRDGFRRDNRGGCQMRFNAGCGDDGDEGDTEEAAGAVQDLSRRRGAGQLHGC